MAFGQRPVCLNLVTRAWQPLASASYDFIAIISDHRSEFADIAEWVDSQDLAVDTFAYRRAKDKGDKSPEVYKFLVNVLYVASMRAPVRTSVSTSSAGTLCIGRRCAGRHPRCSMATAPVS